MIFRIWPRPMRLSPLGMVTRTKVIRKAAPGGKKVPDSGSEKPKAGGIRVQFGGDDGRRQKMLEQWRKSRRVDSGKKTVKAAGRGAVAGFLAARGQFDVTAKMTGRVYRDLQAAKPLSSG